MRHVRVANAGEDRFHVLYCKKFKSELVLDLLDFVRGDDVQSKLDLFVSLQCFVLRFTFETSIFTTFVSFFVSFSELFVSHLLLFLAQKTPHLRRSGLSGRTPLDYGFNVRSASDVVSHQVNETAFVLDVQLVVSENANELSKRNSTNKVSGLRLDFVELAD
mgnify:CR=1 FL=1